MKLKEALPNFDDTLWDRPAKKKKISPFRQLPTEPVSRQDLEIVIDKMNDGSYRAMIKSVKGRAYGTATGKETSHPKEFIASGRTPEQAKEELFKKLKI